MPSQSRPGGHPATLTMAMTGQINIGRGPVRAADGHQVKEMIRIAAPAK
jgi:hypothetical protein